MGGQQTAAVDTCGGDKCKDAGRKAKGKFSGKRGGKKPRRAAARGGAAGKIVKVKGEFHHA